MLSVELPTLSESQKRKYRAYAEDSDDSESGDIGIRGQDRDVKPRIKVEEEEEEDIKPRIKVECEENVVELKPIVKLEGEVGEEEETKPKVKVEIEDASESELSELESEIATPSDSKSKGQNAESESRPRRVAKASYKKLEPSEDSEDDEANGDGASSDDYTESEPEEEYNSGDDYMPTTKGAAAQTAQKKAKAAKQKIKPPPEPPSKAYVNVLAEPEKAAADSSLEGVDAAMLERIKKALNLSRHPGTTEQEAHQALRMAMKLMEKNNITQAAVLATMEESDDRLKQAGQSIVTVRGKPGSNMYVSQWSSIAGSAVAVMFDIKFFTETFGGWENINRVDFVFYGLAPNTVSAAMAFEMVYNLIMAWRMANKQAKGINAKNSYCTGVADGLFSFAHGERRREIRDAERVEKLRLEAAKKTEDEQRQKEIDRLKQPEPSAKDNGKRARVEDESSEHSGVKSSSESDTRDDDSDSDSTSHYDYDGGYSDYARDADSDSDNDQNLDTEDARDMDAVPSHFHNDGDVEDVDVDALVVKSEQRLRDNIKFADDSDRTPDEDMVKKEGQVAVKTSDEPKPLEDKAKETEWESAGALISFRDASQKLAEDYLKQKGVKLRNSSKGKPLRFKDENARESYYQGREDAKKIDLKRKRLTAAEED